MSQASVAGTQQSAMLAASFPLLLLSALLGWQAQQLPLRGQPLKADTTALTCENPPRFRVGYPAGAAAPSLPDQAFNFLGNSWLTTDVCTPGTLRLTAEGQVAGGAAPRLEVALNSRIIWQGEFTQRREVSIPVPGAGHLTVGYFNDYYRSEYRNALLEQMEFKAASCRSFEVTVPEGAGGVWNSGAKTVSWLFAPPITLRPCAAGTLTLRASGQAGGGSFSTISFTQEGRELRRVTLSASPQNLHLKVGAAPVQIRILNPYYKELGDRNTFLKKAVFVPSR